MDLRSFVDLLTVASLAGGLVFAGIQWRQSRLEGRRASQVQVLRSFESPEFVRAMRVILDLPDGLSTSEIEARVGPAGMDLLWFWLGVMESLGVLVHDRFVDIHDVDQTYGGPIIVTFRRLRSHIVETRSRMGRDSMHEWFEWLADQTERLEGHEGRTAAHIRERDWRP